MQLYRSDNKFQITQDFLGPAETFLLNCKRSVFYSLIWVSASAPKTQFQLRLESLVANCVFIGACDRTGDSTAQNWAVVFLSSGQLVEKRMTGDGYDNPTANSKCAGESSQRKFQHIKSKHELQSHDGMSEAHSGCLTAPCPRRFLLLFPQFSVFVSCLIYVWNNKNIPRVPLLFRLPVLSSRFSPPPLPLSLYRWTLYDPPPRPPRLPPQSCPDFLRFSLSSCSLPSHLLCCFPPLPFIFPSFTPSRSRPIKLLKKRQSTQKFTHHDLHF